MAVVLVDLYNQALSRVGTRSRLISTSDVRREAELCNLWYPTVRDTILKAFAWPIAKASAVLILQSQQDLNAWDATKPPPEWRYAYNVPTDFLYPRFMSAWETFDTGTIGAQQCIFTNSATPILTYTKKLTTEFDADIQLYNAIVQGLAAYICEPLTGRGGTAAAALSQSNNIIMEARLAAANEKQTEYEHIPDFLAVRGVGNISVPNRFYFANGPLLMGTVQ